MGNYEITRDLGFTVTSAQHFVGMCFPVGVHCEAAEVPFAICAFGRTPSLATLRSCDGLG